MRSSVPTVLFMLAGCATAAAEEPELPVHGETPGYTCREEGLSSFVGQPATAEAGARILRRAGARTLRWIPHNGVVTMDLRTDRVNVRLSPENRIVSVTCG